MSLDLSPAPAAAPRARRIVNHARIEVAMLVRNGEQLILNLVIPVGLLVGGLLFGGRLGLEVATFPASVMALALWSTGFTSLAINTGFERRQGVLERLVATPLSKADLIAGKALATASVAAGQLVLLGVVAGLLGWRPAPTWPQTLAALTGAALAVMAFAGLALTLAGRLRAEAVLGLANLVYIVVAAGGAVVLPVSAYPAVVQPVLPLLPFGALGELLRGWAGGTASGWPVLVLAAWAALCLLLARKAFRWMS